MKITSDFYREGREDTFRSCVLGDAYGLRKCSQFVESVIDIGAHVGFFSIASRFIIPNARVLAFEPDPETFTDLIENTKNLNIECHNVALGDGNKVSRFTNKFAKKGCYGVRFDTAGDTGIKASSITLGNMFRSYGGELTNAFIKIDCEGSERHIIGDTDSENRLRLCIGVGGEFHDTGEYSIRFSDFKKWITGLLADTHIVSFSNLVLFNRKEVSWRPRSILGSVRVCEFSAVRKSSSFVEEPKNEVKTTKTIRFHMNHYVDGRLFLKGQKLTTDEKMANILKPFAT